MYVSTRGTCEKVSAAAAIKTGLATDGGLFVPENVPHVELSWIKQLAAEGYRQRAVKVLALFLQDYTEAELQECVQQAYTAEKFADPAIAPVAAMNDRDYVLELWHGPTSAFKDMALQLLPQLLAKALVKTKAQEKVVILVATSGDTGKAALAGFQDVGQTQVVVFFPEQGVSEMQKLQMLTQEGRNVAVIAVKGNFDDAQSGVKHIFNDRRFTAALADCGCRLSSANSMNWGRLVPQIVYYFSAYADLVKGGNLAAGDPVNFTVPTGNFGNILAGYYAKRMGLPIHKLLCASNSNNVLTEFLRTGRYDRLRAFHKTVTPSMDILISSNLERLLYYLAEGDSAQVCRWMDELQDQGWYQIGDGEVDKLREIFWCDWVDDADTLAMIREIYDQYRYVADPHTAVAWKVSNSYQKQTGDTTPNVIVSTASPFKFNESVLTALQGRTGLSGAATEFELLSKLSKITGWTIPQGLAQLQGMPVLHHTVCEKAAMPSVVKSILANTGIHLHA
jgi:threonine synthase